MRAPRRHPATAALEDLRGWKRRWATGQTTAETEAILAVESWLRRIAKEPLKRTAKAAPARTAKPATRTPPAAKVARRDPRRPSGHPSGSGQHTGPAADAGGASPD